MEGCYCCFGRVKGRSISLCHSRCFLRWRCSRFKTNCRLSRWRANLSIVPVGIAAIYGGYFGAALGMILLAVLLVVIDDSLIRLDALKQLISLAVNVSAAVVFLFLGRIDWTIGGAIPSRVPAKLLRWTVIVAGLGMSAFFARL